MVGRHAKKTLCLHNYRMLNKVTNHHQNKTPPTLPNPHQILQRQIQNELRAIQPQPRENRHPNGRVALVRPIPLPHTSIILRTQRQTSHIQTHAHNSNPNTQTIFNSNTNKQKPEPSKPTPKCNPQPQTPPCSSPSTSSATPTANSATSTLTSFSRVTVPRAAPHRRSSAASSLQIHW